MPYPIILLGDQTFSEAKMKQFTSTSLIMNEE